MDAGLTKGHQIRSDLATWIGSDYAKTSLPSWHIQRGQQILSSMDELLSELRKARADCEGFGDWTERQRRLVWYQVMAAAYLDTRGKNRRSMQASQFLLVSALLSMTSLLLASRMMGWVVGNRYRSTLPFRRIRELVDVGVRRMLCRIGSEILLVKNRLGAEARVRLGVACRVGGLMSDPACKEEAQAEGRERRSGH